MLKAFRLVDGLTAVGVAFNAYNHNWIMVVLWTIAGVSLIAYDHRQRADG